MDNGHIFQALCFCNHKNTRTGVQFIPLTRTGNLPRHHNRGAGGRGGRKGRTSCGGTDLLSNRVGQWEVDQTKPLLLRLEELSSCLEPATSTGFGWIRRLSLRNNSSSNNITNNNSNNINNGAWGLGTADHE